MEKQFIAYYRVSTQKQGVSGLGLEAQQNDVRKYTEHHNLLAEYTEVESGNNSKRPELHKAIDHCLRTGSTLVIAKLDRLSRNVFFIETLKQKGVKFVCCDMPEANEFVIGIMANMAQFERSLISERTKKALKAKKDRGEKMPGRPKEHCNYMRSCRKPVEYDNNVIYIIKSERKNNKSFEFIANTLNSLNHVTKRNKPYTATAVFRIFNSLK